MKATMYLIKRNMNRSYMWSDIIGLYTCYKKGILTIVYWCNSRGEDLEHVMFRMGILAVLRSKMKKGKFKGSKQIMVWFRYLFRINFKSVNIEVKSR